MRFLPLFILPTVWILCVGPLRANAFDADQAVVLLASFAGNVKDTLQTWWEEASTIAKRDIEAYIDNTFLVASDKFKIAQSAFGQFKVQVSDVVQEVENFRVQALALPDPKVANLDNIEEELAPHLEEIVLYMKTNFPPPDQAPSHDERVMMVREVLGRLGSAVVKVCSEKFGADPDVVWEHWQRIEKPVEVLIVGTGDLVEQHPYIAEALLETLIISAVLMLLPEAWLLRRVLSLFGFSPLGPVKGTPASWAQRVFFGRSIRAGSWFAALQSVAMKTPALSWLGVLMAGLVGLFSFRRCFGS